MGDEIWKKAHSLVKHDAAVDLKILLDGLPHSERDALLGSLLVEATESKSSESFALLLGYGPAISLGVGEALGVAARAGNRQFVLSLLATDPNFEEPPWEPETDSEHALIGMMLSMDKVITKAVCDAGVVDRADAGWINEAIALGLGSRKRDRIECLMIFGSALADRLERDENLSLDAGALSRLAKRLTSAANPRMGAREIAGRLSARVDRESALREQMIQHMVDGHFEKMLASLESLPDELARRLGPELLAWAAGLSGPAESAEPDFGWWAVERLIDLGFDLDGVDGYGRTALAYVVWRTRGREDLIQKMLDRGADINAVDIDHNMKRSSILDYSKLNAAKGSYHDILRSLGAKTAEELQAEDRES